MGNKAIETLRLFNQKVSKLEGLSFIDTILNTKTYLNIVFFPGEPISAKRFGPNQEAIDAFTLTLRFFIQNNEPISFMNIGSLYETLPIETKLKNKLLDIRAGLNEFLDGPSPITLSNEVLKRRKIFDVFLWGGLAHSNKVEEFEKWYNDDFAFPILEDQFVLILIEILNVIFYIRDLNNIVINQLGN